MSENNQNVEKEAVKEPAGESAAQSVRDSFVNEALSSAMKGAQAAGEAVSKNSIGNAIKDGAGAAAAGAADALPKMSIHEGANSLDKNQMNQIGEHMGKAAGSALQDLLKNKDGNGNSNSEAMKHADELGQKLKDGMIKPEDFHNSLKDLLKPKDGVEKLPTGDFLVREDGKQTLFTPNGDRVTVNPDGTSSIKGDVRKVTTGKDGSTTVEFKDGASVTFDKDGIRDVTRGNQSVSFGRPFDFHKEPHPMPKPEPQPHPWPFPPKPEPLPHPSPRPEPWPRPRYEDLIQKYKTNEKE